ncbi:MAG: glycosyltransferase family 4 protein [Chromatiaceae bacterium]|nr:glycosyltransferase family 4 protein [Chromatiaceae bacterium]MCF8003281.1 glycosyltransferase family 4 protein [Chromatiaceae bacterium]MCF8015543.1 glycosyltransferase family 4 protein [Chromatiaceae bacterium]
MKICYLIPGCGVSGGIAVICQHSERLKARGHEVSLVVDGMLGDMSWFPGQSVPVVPLTDYPQEVDILIATSWATAFRVPLLLAKRHAYFVQSDETRFHPPGSCWEHITRLSYVIPFNYLTEAHWIRTWLQAQFGHEAALVPNGLDTSIFYPCEPLAPRGRRPRILLEGAIALPYKGMWEAFEAVKPIDAEIWCVSSCGKPDPAWRCDRFFSAVPMEQMREIYSSCDLLLKLSRVEGFFGPPMEMMACGGAVVVGRVTGYDEYIIDGENALVVDPFDIQAARAAVQRLLEDTALREHLIANGRATVARWNWDSSINRLEQALQALLVDPSRALSSPQRVVAESIAYFYGELRGEPLLPDPPISAKNARLLADPTEFLVGRLRRQGWFRVLARLLVRGYQKWRSLLKAS